MNPYYQLAMANSYSNATKEAATFQTSTKPTLATSTYVDRGGGTTATTVDPIKEEPTYTPTLDPTLELVTASEMTQPTTYPTKPTTNIYIQDGLLSGGLTKYPLPTAEVETPIDDLVGGGGGFGGGGGMGEEKVMDEVGNVIAVKTWMPLIVIAAGIAVIIFKPLK